ncbi:sulfurtransferase complex subunit TusC [Moellerella wisconsensis]|uniref:TusC family tRNA 5-methylaminomethyl-2-thiouridine synthase n=1 Tax=Moellerella wisconsensis ATCC 35017 TaxID=1354267 RepID=A0A0N0IBG9_9GAMM|nr:sulfurtransferase complex subunit TusC [Moellerella wisconsensis]KPD03902.1 TusC family tRNA 5-methylaminomethyl-2-thiouridine synthase [Moellerella wisconsensis ATCC 35017]VFS50356.1 tRNA 2-thiouridine synthesizing protein C [Moellerella wisconsensis]
MKKIAFVFTTMPHGQSHGREGLDALLATSALTDNIAVFFLSDGVCQLLKHQQPALIHSRDYISTFKILPLYDIEQCYICHEDLVARGLSSENELIIDAEIISAEQIGQKLAQFDVVLKF